MKYLFAIIITLLPLTLLAQPPITFQQVITGLNQPVDAVEVNDGSGRLFIVEKTGRVRIHQNGVLKTNPFLNISTLVSPGGEQGFLSMAFHPNYNTNGYFYVYYNNTSGNITVARYSRATIDSASFSSGVVLLSIPKRFTNHNGGKLLFGTDGYLYFATGDGGSGGDPDNNAQNTASLLGKMLRIDVNNPNPPYYSIPPTNPFATSSTAKKEIYSIGLRNPWRWSFDKQTNDMWVTDVGQNAWEEVNALPFANSINRNYGWRCFEGTHVYNSSCTAQANNVVPVFDYPHNDTTGGYSITGGYVYRGTEFPSLFGYYIFTDYATGIGWLTKPNGAGGYTTTMQKNWLQDITSFVETVDGTLYVTKIGGTIHKVIAGSALPVKLLAFKGKESGNKFTLEWQVENEEKDDIYIIEKNSNPGERFTEISKTSASSNRTSNSYKVAFDVTEPQIYYRLKIISRTGQIIYSNIISHGKSRKQYLQAVNIGNSLSITLPSQTTSLQVFDAVGRILFKQNQTTASTVNIPMASVAKGIVTIRALVNGDWQVVKVIR